MNDLKIRPITSPEQMELVLSEARKDQPGVHLVSHVIKVDDEIRGAAMTMPMVLLCMKKDNKPRLTKDIMTNLENVLANTGNAFVCIPCHTGSVQAGYMERLGYTKLEDYTLFVKGL